MELRDYQKKCIRALWAYWKQSPDGAPLLVCPTGSGKSFIIANVIKDISKKHPKFRFLIATHTKEIVSQNALELCGILGEKTGVFSAGLRKKQIERITFANIQSIVNSSKDIEFDMLIIDEAHLVSKNESSMYQTLIRDLKEKTPLKILGLTATPMRLDQGSLISPGSTFTDIGYEIGVFELIDKKFLSPLISMPKKEVNLKGVRKSGYDFSQVDMERVFDKADLINSQVEEIIKTCFKDRKHWLIFCTGITHAKNVSIAFEKKGIKSTYLTGQMSKLERDEIIGNFKSGKIKALCNVGVLTTGFNFKAIDTIVLLRATKSTSLYIQCVGRGSRTEVNKKNCLVLDYGGNIRRHGPIDCIRVEIKKQKEKGTVRVVPTKVCEECGCIVPIATLVCPNCDNPFPIPETLDSKASNACIISKGPVLSLDGVERTPMEIITGVVEKQEFTIKYSVLKPAIFVARFWGKGLNFPIEENFCFDHSEQARQGAGRAWVRYGGLKPPPMTSKEAYERRKELKTLSWFRVEKTGKFRNITSFK